MNSRTHLLIAMFFGFWYFKIAPNFTLLEKFIFASFIVGASLLPDIDTPTSSLGRKHKLISSISKHRGIFHAVWIPLIAFAFIYVYPVFRAPLTGIAIGYGSHLFADTLTKEGITPLAPFSKKKVRGPLRTGHVFETIIAAAVVMFFLTQPI